MWELLSAGALIVFGLVAIFGVYLFIADALCRHGLE